VEFGPGACRDGKRDAIARAHRRARGAARFVRAQRFRRLVALPIIGLAMAAALAFTETYTTKEAHSFLIVIAGVSLPTIGLWMIVTIILIVFDYGREFAGKARKLLGFDSAGGK
jgi:hypothetical protein